MKKLTLAQTLSREYYRQVAVIHKKNGLAPDRATWDRHNPDLIKFIRSTFA